MTRIEIGIVVNVFDADKAMAYACDHAVGWGFAPNYTFTLEEAVYEIVRSDADLVAAGLEVVSHSAATTEEAHA
jgi:hypothetical protein